MEDKRDGTWLKATQPCHSSMVGREVERGQNQAAERPRSQRAGLEVEENRLELRL